MLNFSLWVVVLKITFFKVAFDASTRLGNLSCTQLGTESTEESLRENLSGVCVKICAFSLQISRDNRNALLPLITQAVLQSHRHSKTNSWFLPVKFIHQALTLHHINFMPIILGKRKKLQSTTDICGNEWNFTLQFSTFEHPYQSKTEFRTSILRIKSTPEQIDRALECFYFHFERCQLGGMTVHKWRTAPCSCIKTNDALGSTRFLWNRQCKIANNTWSRKRNNVQVANVLNHEYHQFTTPTTRAVNLRTPLASRLGVTEIRQSTASAPA